MASYHYILPIPLYLPPYIATSMSHIYNRYIYIKADTRHDALEANSAANSLDHSFQSCNRCILTA